MRRGRSRNPNENPGVRPIQRIDLPEKVSKKRIVVFVILLAVGIGFLGYAVFGLISQEEGWTQIEPTSQIGESVASELVFLYDLGAGELSAAAEYKQLALLYTDLCAKAYRLFHADFGFEDVKNLHYINHNPNTEITVDPALYSAFERIERSGNRFLYAGAFYTEYKNLFSDTEDASAAMLDPLKNAEIAAYFKELSEFTANEEHIRLELLEDSKVRLSVSEEYLAYAEEQGIESFIDLYWTRNAFVIDYIVEELIKNGFTNGSISSYDGFMRTADERETAYSYHLYSSFEKNLYEAARFDYKGKNSIVFLRSYRLSERDEIYYVYQTGEQRHAYVDVTDGICKNALESLVSYSYEKSCSEVLLSMMPVYISDDFYAEGVRQMKEESVYSIYFKKNELHYNDPEASFERLYKDEKVAFVTVLEP